MTKESLIQELKKVIGGEIPKIVLNEIEFNAEYGATYRKGKNWRDFNVYIPEFSKNYKIGYPYVIFAKRGSARLSTENESLELLDVE